MTSAVTDTDAKIISASSFLLSMAFMIKTGQKLGSVDHLLGFTTKAGFIDSPETLGARSVCHSIVKF